MTKRLNLGCGDSKRADFINIDIDPQWHPDILRDLARGLPFNDDSVDEVYCRNTLEHIENDDAIFLLQEVHRVLKIGGTFELIVPLGVVPDLSHKSFYHEYTFENLMQQHYRYSLGKFVIDKKEVVVIPKPFDYLELRITFHKGG